MADRIKGITVEIGGDTTGLNKALSGTNKEIKSTQSQLKDVERLLKLDPKNTELLAQKQRLLGNAIGETKSKLDTLKNAEKQVQEQFKQGKVSQEQYDALQREIVATEQSLKSLKEQAKSTHLTMEKIGSVAGTIATKTKGLSMAAGGALVALGGMAVSAGKSADDINTLAKQTGLSTEQIQKFSYASDIIDVDLETLTKSMAKLTKNMATAQKGTGDAAEAFKTLGIKIKNSDGTLRNNQDVFNETIKALGKIENETQRDAYAMQIFGKSAQDLNPLILGGADALEELGQQAEDAGLILSQDTLDAANEFNDVLDILKAKGMSTFAKVGSALAKNLMPVIERLAGWLEKLLIWFGNLSPEMQNTILIVLGLTAAISPLAKIISGIPTIISGISGALDFLAKNPIVAIVAAIATIIAIIKTLWEKSEKFRTFFTNLWDGIKTTVGPIIDTIKTAIDGIVNALKKVVQWCIDAIDWLEDLFNVGDWDSFTGKVKKAAGIGGGAGRAFANGGTLTSGAALVGERGPELLTMQGGRAVVEPLYQTNKNAHLTSTFNMSFNNGRFNQRDAQQIARLINTELGKMYR